MRGTMSYRIVDATGRLFQGAMPYVPEYDGDDSARDDDDLAREPIDCDEFDALQRVLRTVRHEEEVTLQEPITGTVEFHLVSDFEFENYGWMMGKGRRSAANEAALAESCLLAPSPVLPDPTEGRPTVVHPDAPLWEISVLYGCLEPEYDDPRHRGLSWLVRCDPRQLTVPIGDYARAHAIARMKARRIRYDAAKLQVEVRESDMHIVTRDGVDVLEPKPEKIAGSPGR